MSTGALTGYRILDLANESGLYGTKVLADLGAEVIRIEPPEGSPLRRIPPIVKSEAGDELSLYFAYMNTNKRSITLDLESSEGQALFRRLAGSSDAVFETSPFGYMAERGIGCEQLSKENPKLVWVSLTPFGLSGPHRDWKASDLVAWASTGAVNYNGFPGQTPIAPAPQLMLGYSLGGLNMAAGCLLALQSRETTGRGQLVEVSLQETLLISQAEAAMPSFLDDLLPRVRFGNRRPWAVPMGIFPCTDGYVQLVIAQPYHWTAFAAWHQEKTGSDELADPALQDRLLRLEMPELVEPAVERLTMLYTKQEFFEEAQRRGIPSTPANTLADLTKDPQLAARNYWSEMNDPKLGRLRMPGAPYFLSETPWQPGRSPQLGEHNDAVYGGQLGLSTSEIEGMRSRGVI